MSAAKRLIVKNIGSGVRREISINVDRASSNPVAKRYRRHQPVKSAAAVEMAAINAGMA